MFDLLEIFEGDERERPRRGQNAPRQQPRGRFRGWISRMTGPFDDDDHERNGRARHRKQSDHDFGWD